ncbi:hypothetical protein MVEN_02010600 [Mycena venus]|uniref:F-box domain-containing protein n=1 Tax=Mycena venus TaxID=2733690 RepID=A0A8H6XC91_9AGAR|nr:hypothetical protein MVEN_02010600 [Mycena venus]
MVISSYLAISCHFASTLPSGLAQVAYAQPHPTPESAHMASSSSWALAGPNFGHLSNQEAEYPSPTQSVIVKDSDGRLRFTRFTRRDSTLPTEILTLIFIHCLPEDDFVIPRTTTAPLLLCVICRGWREITLSTPKLWSSLALRPMHMLNRELYGGAGFNQMRLSRGRSALSFDCPEISDTEGAGFYQGWLSRARAAPLSLCADYLEFFDLGPRASLIKSLIALSQQWQNVMFSFPDEGLFSSLPANGKYPLLEKMSLSFLWDFLHRSTPISFCDAPKLREVILSPYDRHIQFPWHQLTSFRTDNIREYSHSVHSFLEILGRASNLVDASFDIVKFDPFSLPQAAVLLPYLQSLKLKTQNPDSLMTLLSCLKAPSLKNLILMSSYRGLTDISPFLSFVSRSSFQLHTLKLSCVFGTTDLLIQCLKAVPSVVHLELRPSGLDIDMMLAQFTGHPDFLPKLESFHLFALYPSSYGATPTIATDVLNMLCRRWAAVDVTRLQSFRLAYDVPRSSCDGKIPGLGDTLSSHSKFRQLQEEGMVFVHWTARLYRLLNVSYVLATVSSWNGH